jgi:hypothetical protein
MERKNDWASKRQEVLRRVIQKQDSNAKYRTS